MTRHLVLGAGAVGIAMPFSAFAEIADKMPSRNWLLGECFVLGWMALALGLWRPWLALLPAAWAFLGLLNAWHDAHDPGFAEAIGIELGPNYTPIAYATSLIPVLVAAVMIGLKVWRRRNGGLPPYTASEQPREK